MSNSHADALRRDFIALHKRQRENISIMDSGYNMQRHHLFVRFTGPDTSVAMNGVVFTRFDTMKREVVVEAVKSQAVFFGNLRRNFEWKLLSYDLPDYLPEILSAEGFQCAHVEDLMVMTTDAQQELEEIPGIRIEEVTSVEGFKDIKTVEEAVWGDDATLLVTSLQKEKKAAPDLTRLFVAYADTKPVSCGWLRMDRYYGQLLGGSTLPEWRGKGIYRQLVKRRTNIAREKGLRFVACDAGAKSAPILEKLGFVSVAKVMRFHKMV